MAKSVKVAGIKFELLDSDEAAQETSYCDHKWAKSHLEIIVNPAHEFVKGFGSGYVAVRIAAGKYCEKCGLFITEKETEKYVHNYGDKLDRILQMRSKVNRTICQMLRELRDEVGPKQQKTIDACLLIAKKMNDKLVGYAGKHYTKSWYDEDGNFII